MDISKKLRFLQITTYDGGGLHIWYQIKGPIIILHFRDHAVNLDCIEYLFFSKKKHDAKNCLPIFSLKIYVFWHLLLQPLRNIVLKLFDDKCEAKACKT